MNNKKRTNILLLILFIVLVSTFVIIITNPIKKQNKYVYNGFVVSKFRIKSAPDVIFHNIDFFVDDKKYSVPLRNDPQNIEDIIVEDLDKVKWIKNSLESSNYNILAKKIYITFDPIKYSGGDLGIAGGEIAKIIGSSSTGIYKIPTGGAFTKLLDGYTNIIKDCDDANSETGIILLTLGNENRINVEEDCIIIEGNSYDGLIKSADRFLLALLGVIPQ